MAAQEPFPGAEQLQAAALGMIAASRVVLDVMEALVRDPNTATQVTQSIGQAARTILETVGRHAPGSNGDAAPGSGYERIEVS